MNKEDIERNLRRTLKISSVDESLIVNRESTVLEFKRKFDLGSASKYARTLAAFANNKGGYIVFGVENAPRVLRGINPRRFQDVDPAKLTAVLNDFFSPEIIWEIGQFEYHGVTLGYIYGFEAYDKPIIATKSKLPEIRESAVYYRYRANTTFIKYAELNKIIEERLERDRKAWLHHLESIGRVGPTNVGIVDTIEGKLFTGGTSLMLSETLTRQLRFIREGRFVDTDGDPTLRLIGDVKSLSGATTEVPIPVGIHYDDVVTTFLSQMNISKDEALSYFRECAFMNSFYTPIYYYISNAGLSIEDAEKVLQGTDTPYRSVKNKLLRRIRNSELVLPVGVVETKDLDEIPNDKEAFFKILDVQKNAKERRSLIYKLLSSDTGFIRSIAPDLPAPRLFEAITHLEKDYILANSNNILGIMQNLFQTRFKTYSGLTKGAFRKALRFLDESISIVGNT